LVDTGRAPTFRTKRDTILDNGEVGHGFVPLQAADWLAYEIQHATVQFEENRLNEFRWPMEEFHRIHGEPTTYTAEDTEKMEKLLDASKEINKFSVRLQRIKDSRSR
jgi:hypothetical protein